MVKLKAINEFLVRGRAAMLFLGLCCAFGCGAGNPSRGEALREFTGGHTRVVWCQDLGEGTDIYAGGSGFRLMGLDSDDGAGEREILSGPSSYARPLITPRGDRVIFSDRADGKMYIVNWDGTGLALLGKGFALDTLLDAEGREWVYFGAEPRQVARQDVPKYSGIMRCPIDEPARRELVWDQQPVIELSECNFQVSGDGTKGSMHGLGICGVVELPNRGWKNYGAGCWPSIAPDNSYRFWHFEGGHRSMLIYDHDAANRRKIVVSTAPNIDGYEVFHPRWSNHPRFITMTGPLKMAGGGPEVEIHIGRFNEAYDAIEDWITVTDNGRADFFPDVWIESGLSVDMTPAERSGEPRRAGLTWPVQRDGLEFLWADRSADNEVVGSNGVRVCRVIPKGRARFGRYLQMQPDEGFFVADGGVDDFLSRAKANDAFTFESVVFTTSYGVGSEEVISLGSDDGATAFGLVLADGVWGVKVSTSGSSSGTFFPLFAVQTNVPYHFIISYSPGHLVGFVNGVRVLLTEQVTGGLEGWPSEGRLVFGVKGKAAGAWRGTVEGVALFSRRMYAAEAKQDSGLYGFRVRSRVPATQVAAAARLITSSRIPEIEDILPYRSALVGDVFERAGGEAGDSLPERFLVYRWAIMDEETLAVPPRVEGDVYPLVLEPFDEHPELEGERLVTDTEEFLLPAYYEVPPERGTR